MVLNVPLIRQDKNSVDCGIASSNMLTKYWGLNLSFSDIQKQLKVNKYGIYCPQLALFFLKNGFEVTIVTFNPTVYSLQDVGLTGEKLKSHLEKFLTSNIKSIESTSVPAIRFFLKFLEAGGKLEIHIPTEKDIREEIKIGNPTIVSLTSRFLVVKEPKLNYHFNVVTGIDKENIYVNDSAWDERGGKRKHKISDFMFGMYASVAGGVDNPSVIKIHKKR